MFHIGNPQIILNQNCVKKRDLTGSNYDVLIWADINDTTMLIFHNRSLRVNRVDYFFQSLPSSLNQFHLMGIMLNAVCARQ